MQTAATHPSSNSWVLGSFLASLRSSVLARQDLGATTQPGDMVARPERRCLLRASCRGQKALNVALYDRRATDEELKQTTDELYRCFARVVLLAPNSVATSATDLCNLLARLLKAKAGSNTAEVAKLAATPVT